MNLRTEANFCRQEKEEENYKRTLREIIYAKEKKNIYGDVKWIKKSTLLASIFMLRCTSPFKAHNC